MPQPLGLVPLDGSATAEAVLPWAVALARALGLRLMLLQLVGEDQPGAGAALQPARHYLAGVAASLTASGAAVDTQVQPVIDDVAVGINSVAEALDAGMIMLASHGRSGIRRWVMGSVAEVVVRTASRPVLVVPAHPEAVSEEVPTIHRILLPLDGSPLSEQALPLAVGLAQACAATLDLVQVQPWSWSLPGAALPEVVIPEGFDEQIAQAAEEYLQAAQARLPAGLSAEHHLIRREPASGILDHLSETGADLVVMSTHGRSGLVRWALGSVAERVLRASPRPVLLVRATEPEMPGGETAEEA